MMRWLRMWVGLLAAAGLVLGGLWLGQRRLIYFPGGPPAGIQVGLAGWQEVTLATSDGLDLAAWYRPPPLGRPVVLVFNGNGGNRQGRLSLGVRLVAMGYGVLLFDYRGYGGNPGTPSERGLALDARAAAGFLRTAADGSPVVYFGESLGAAVAVELAEAHPPAGLVLRSPFTSLAEVARVHYPYLPTGVLLRDEYPSLDRISTLAVPLLVVAGSADSIVPVEQSRRLYEAAAEPKRLIVIAGADHNDAALIDGEELVRTVAGFIDAHAGT